jgi:ABC-type uncharacterized transport system substrate-binding protein
MDHYQFIDFICISREDHINTMFWAPERFIDAFVSTQGDKDEKIVNNVTNSLKEIYGKDKGTGILNMAITLVVYERLFQKFAEDSQEIKTNPEFLKVMASNKENILLIYSDITLNEWQEKLKTKLKNL